MAMMPRKLQLLPEELIAQISEHLTGIGSARYTLRRMRLVCRAFNRAVDESFIKAYIRDRIQAFTVDSLGDLLNLVSIPRFAEAVDRLQLRFMHNELKTASPIAADLLRSILRCISKCNRQIAIKIGDSPTRKMLRARKPRSEQSFRDSEVYFNVIVHILRTIDYPGSPVVGLEVSHLSDGCTWLSKPDGRWGVSSLRNLTSLKLGFDPETSHHRHQAPRPYFGAVLGDFNFVLETAIHLRELSIKVACYFDRGPAVFRLEVSSLCPDLEIVRLITLFRDSLTSVILSDLWLEDRSLAPHILSAVATFPVLEHVRISEIAYLAYRDDIRNVMSYQYYGGLRLPLDIKNDFTTILNDLASLIDSQDVDEDELACQVRVQADEEE